MGGELSMRQRKPYEIDATHRLGARAAAAGGGLDDRDDGRGAGGVADPAGVGRDVGRDEGLGVVDVGLGLIVGRAAAEEAVDEREQAAEGRLDAAERAEGRVAGGGDLRGVAGDGRGLPGSARDGRTTTHDRRHGRDGGGAGRRSRSNELSISAWADEGDDGPKYREHNRARPSRT